MVAGLVESLAGVRGWSRRRTTMATLATIGSYVVLSGAGAAALRSSLMVGAGLLLSRDGRRPHSFALLGLCAALLLAIEPAVATDVGFQLSFLGTAGILVLASPIAARVPGPRLLAEPFAVTIAAQLATAPITAGTFGVLSLVGPFANALVLPLIPLLIVVGGAGALLGTVLPALAWAPLQAAGLACTVMLAIAQGASALPLAAIHLQLWPSAWTVIEVAAAGAGGLAWFLHERWLPCRAGSATVAAVAALAAGIATTSVAAAATAAPLRVTVLDVGNGSPSWSVPRMAATCSSTAARMAQRCSARWGERYRRWTATSTRWCSPRPTAPRRRRSPASWGTTTWVAGRLAAAAGGAGDAAATLLAGTGTRVIVAGPSAWSVGGLSARCVAAGPLATSPCVLQLTDGRSTALVTGNLAQASQDELAGVAGSWLRADLLVGPNHHRAVRRPPGGRAPHPRCRPRQAHAAGPRCRRARGHRDRPRQRHRLLRAARRRLCQRHRLMGRVGSRLRAGRRRHRMAPAHNVVVTTETPGLLLVHGDEPYLVDRTVAGWRSSASGDVEVLDAPAKLEPLIASLVDMPLFAAERHVLVRDLPQLSGSRKGNGGVDELVQRPVAAIPEHSSLPCGARHRRPR